MNIDWSKAPEGATHYSPACDNYFASWCKFADGKLYGWLADGDERWDRIRQQEADGGKIEAMIKRPAQWTGEGLPPVGLKVECLVEGNGDWRKMTLKYKSLDFSVFEVDGGEEFPLWNPQNSTFRPIRTPEQIAEESRELAIKDLMQVDDVYYQQAADIYDRGYRKFEIVDQCGHTNEYNEGSTLSCKFCGKG